MIKLAKSDGSHFKCSEYASPSQEMIIVSKVYIIKCHCATDNQFNVFHA